MIIRFPGVRHAGPIAHRVAHPTTRREQFLADLKALSASHPCWWDDFCVNTRFLGSTLCAWGGVLLPCSGCGAAPITRCRCAPRWGEHYRKKLWNGMSAVERAVYAALAELRAEQQAGGPNAETQR